MTIYNNNNDNYNHIVFCFEIKKNIKIVERKSTCKTKKQCL